MYSNLEARTNNSLKSHMLKDNMYDLVRVRYVLKENMINILFICSENKLRSATAETVFSKYKDVQAIGSGTNKDSATPVSGDLIEWADIILVMENMHKSKVTKKYNALLRNKRIVVLDIQDNYSYMQPELISLLEDKVSRFVNI